MRSEQTRGCSIGGVVRRVRPKNAQNLAAGSRTEIARPLNNIMKLHIELSPNDSSASTAIHRAVQGRFEASKTHGHRYERRKVREFLRRPEAALN